MTNQERLGILVEIGQSLYGERWQVALSRDIGVNQRTVRRWVSGESNVPPGIYLDLRKILLERRKKISFILG